MKHSYKIFVTTFAGISNFPELLATLLVDGVEVGYCDSNNRREAKQEAAKKLLKDNRKLLEDYTRECSERPKRFRNRLRSFMQAFNQSGGKPWVLAYPATRQVS